MGLHATTTSCPGSSSSTWPVSAGTRPATSRPTPHCSTTSTCEIGEFPENLFLFEFGCSDDPAERVVGVNRCLEGLALDVFNDTIRFGKLADDEAIWRSRRLRRGRRGHPRSLRSGVVQGPHRERPGPAQEGRRLPAQGRPGLQPRGPAGLLRRRQPGRRSCPLAVELRKLAGFTDADIAEVAGAGPKVTGSPMTTSPNGAPANGDGARSPATAPSRHAQPFPYWDRRRLMGEWTVEESVERIVNYKWAEQHLSAALGGWVATIPELDVKAMLGPHCYQHAWHADLWRLRLPELREANEAPSRAGQRRVRCVHGGAHQPRRRRPDHREARRDLPGARAAPAGDVHVPPAGHLRHRRRPDGPDPRVHARRPHIEQFVRAR